jgi:hypothetical protein
VPSDGEISEKAVDLDRTHLARVALAVETSEVPNPGAVCRLRPPAVMSLPRRNTHAFEEAQSRVAIGGYWLAHDPAAGVAPQCEPD